MLGEKLKEYRKRKGWNQEDLAKYSGYSRSSIINWEKGKRAPRTVDVEKLAQTLGVSQYDLLGVKNEQTYEADKTFKLQAMPVIQETAGYAYWGGVLDEAKRVAQGRDMQEIDVILPILKLACEMLISVRDSKGKVTEVPLPNISAYNGDHSNYNGNKLIVDVPA